VAEVVVASVRPATLLAGKVLGVGAVGLLQMLIWVAAALAMLRYRVPLLQQFGMTAPPIQLPAISPAMLAVLLAFFVLGYTFYSALFAAVGAMVSSEQEAQQAQLPVILLLVVTIMFLQPVLLAPDSPLAQTLGFVPFSAPIAMPLRMSASEVAPWEIALSMAGLLVACLVAVYVAARIYRAGVLMHGKRAGLSELARAIRGSR
jgi:ABC-2 type transport system permease protein